MNTKVYSKKDRTITEELYDYFLKHGEDDGWGERDKYGNFQSLIKIVDFAYFPLKDASILDVGCGTGDMAGFLRGFDIGEYSGIDIVELSIKFAQLKYPKENFKKADFLRAKIDSTYDYIFSSGTLAAVLSTDNYVMLEAFIEKMWRHTRHGVAFNFLTKGSENEIDDTLFLYDLDRVLSICKKAAPKTRVEYILNRAGDTLEFLQTHVYLIK